MKTKDAGLRIRVDRQLREEFVEACRAREQPAAQVLREFMRRYIEAQRGRKDPDPSHRLLLRR